MAIQMELKTQFATREGTYRLMTLSEYSRPNRVGYQTNQNSPQVRVSLVTLPTSPTNAAAATTTTNTATNITTNSTSNSSTTSTIGAAQSTIINSTNIIQDGGPMQMLSSPPSLLPPVGGGGDRICFNFGKELYVYAYRGCKKVSI